MQSTGSTLNRMSVRVGRRGLLPRRVILLLPEWRQQIAPMTSVIGRESNATLIKPDSTVIHSSQKVVGPVRIEHDAGFCLPAEPAVLVDANITFILTIPAAQRAR